MLNHGESPYISTPTDNPQGSRLNSRSDAGASPAQQTHCDSLSAHADQTRFVSILEGEAGNRAQSDIRCGVTLALTGSSYGEIEPTKAT